MKNYEEKWSDIIKYLAKYLDEQKINWLKEYIEDAGEYDVAFNLIVEYILDKNIPLSDDIFQWIESYGKESEKLGNDVNPDWRRIKQNFNPE